MKDQRALKKSCPPQNPIVKDLLTEVGFLQNKKPLSAIDKYKTVQTGANTQLGGVKDGKSSVLYHE